MVQFDEKTRNLERYIIGFSINKFIDQFIKHHSQYLSKDIIDKFKEHVKIIEYAKVGIREQIEKEVQTGLYDEKMTLQVIYQKEISTFNPKILDSLNLVRKGRFNTEIADMKKRLYRIFSDVGKIQKIQIVHAFLNDIKENDESDPENEKIENDLKEVELDFWKKGDKSVLTSVLMELGFIKWLETKGVDKQYQQAYAVRKILNMDKQTAIKDTDRLITFYESEVPKNREVVDKKINDFIKDVKDFTNK